MSEVKVNKISPRTNCGTVTVGDSGDSVSVSAGVPVTVNGDLKSNALKATDGGSIISQCGTNITLGASGDTVSLASGASQSGFGRTGTVNWNTTKITADPGNAVSGVGYFTDTSGGAFNVTLPSSPNAGDIVAVSDYANTWDTNNLTIARNGSNIEGDASDFICNIEGSALTLVYVDATKGWIATDTANSSDVFLNNFVAATGGTITCCGDFKVHTFTGPGTFSVTNTGPGSSTIEYLVVAGGAGGGGGYGGGGGAGGFRTNFPSPGISVSVQEYPITVGGGGARGASPSNAGSNGNPSSGFSITSTGGGGGASYPTPLNGGSGGSGGGGSGVDVPPASGSGGSGNSPSVSPPQGNNGGNGTGNLPGNRGGPGGGIAGGGGGGATGTGTAGTTPNTGGPGGAGTANSISFSSVTRAGGGGGGSGIHPGSGGAGGGGAGSGDPAAGTAGTTNTGGGGGGAGTGSNGGGNGGSGVVIIRYKFQ